MKISTCHHENLDLSSWKSGPSIMKIPTCHYENLDLASWKSRPVIMKIWTWHHENLDLSSWKSRTVIMKISTCHHENLDPASWKSRPYKVSILRFYLKFGLNKIAASRWKFFPRMRAVPFSNRNKSINFLYCIHM